MFFKYYILKKRRRISGVESCDNFLYFFLLIKLLGADKAYINRVSTLACTDVHVFTDVMNTVFIICKVNNF